MKRKLIIHIGSHKTGSTSIQKAMFINKNRLLEKNNFFCNNLYPDGRSAGSCDRFEYHNKNNIKKLFFFLNQKKSNVIISTEGLWYCNKDVALLYDELAKEKFDDIKIIAYIRRQEMFYISAKQSSVKFKSLNRLVGHHFRSLPGSKNIPTLALEGYLNYDKVVSIWGDIFGDENIIIRPFDKKQLYKNDVVSDFFHSLGFELDIPSVSVNESYSWEKTKVGHLLNKMDLHISSPTGKVIFNNLDNSGKMLPSKAQAKEFYEKYKESNLLLNERFKISKNPYIFDDDFSMYPDVANDTWDEEKANQAILNILKGVKEYSQIQEKKINNLTKQNESYKNKLEKVKKKLKEIESKKIKLKQKTKGILSRIKNKLKKYPTLVKLKRKILG